MLLLPSDAVNLRGELLDPARKCAVTAGPTPIPASPLASEHTIGGEVTGPIPHAAAPLHSGDPVIGALWRAETSPSIGVASAESNLGGDSYAPPPRRQFNDPIMAVAWEGHGAISRIQRSLRAAPRRSANAGGAP